MGRQIEATQFTREDYEAAKKDLNASSVGNFRLNSMLKLQEMEKDPKSELNTRLGGVANIRRVRVLRDSDDTDPDPKKLTLAFEHKTPIREFEDRRRQAGAVEEAKKERQARKMWPIFVPDMRIEVLRNLKAARALYDTMPGDQSAERTKLSALILGIEEEGFTDELLLGGRLTLLELLNGSEKEMQEMPGKSAFNLLIDRAQSYLSLAFLGGTFNPQVFADYYHQVVKPVLPFLSNNSKRDPKQRHRPPQPNKNRAPQKEAPKQ